jgi:hypothetical protein
MKRPFGVICSAIILLLGSLFQLLLATMMAFSGFIIGKQMATGGLPTVSPAQPLPSWMPIYMYCLCGFFVALAAWGIVTTVGLFRLRRWARYSVMIIGGALAFVGLTSTLVTFALLFVPLPIPATVDASQAQTAQSMTKVVFAVVGFMYLVVGAVGVSWLVYFNLKRVSAAFTSSAGVAAKSRRPLAISAIAILNMISPPCLLIAALLPFPAVFCGLMLHGWQKAAFYVVFAALQAATAAGLWQLREWGRWLGVGMMAVGVVQFVIYLVRPSLLLQTTAEMTRMMAPMPSPLLPDQFQTAIMSVSLGFSALFCIAIAAILIYYRKAFQHPIEPMQGQAIALT